MGDNDTQNLPAEVSQKAISTEVGQKQSQTNSLLRKKSSKETSHLPRSFVDRPGAVDSDVLLMRLTSHPIPRLQNPASLYLNSLHTASGAGPRLYMLNHIAQEIFGAKDYEHLHWEDLTPPIIRGVMSKIRDAGYKPASRNAYLSTLKAVAREAWTAELMDSETLEKIRSLKPMKHETAAAGQALDLTILKTLIQAARDDGTPTANRDALIISFMAFMGIRREELTKIQLPKDINFKEQDIHIHGKGNKDRTLSPPSPVWDALIHYLDTERGYDKGALFCPYWNKRTLPRVSDEGLSITSINKIMTKVRRRCGDLLNEKVTPHDMRRSFATVLDKKGLSIREIQILMGHSSSTTTERYLRDNKDGYRKKAASALSDDLS
ncbi:site-specific integrase [Halomonas sp. I5-271120]|uniref:tyrosine-type recombinase/integrase n=1 Tax=Halomonas sp. I5-271120 TaxID=3061632 RepID=UPI0027153DDB|nr:site-specific integrase [Halomonas sp. I5-271120]